jgi:hypothetical protein
MKKYFITTFLLLNLSFYFTNAQETESFFPSQVGNVWQYYGIANLWQGWSILRDSVASDGYRYLYVGLERYPGQELWWYRIDSTFNVYSGPGHWSDTLYYSNSDSGDVWLRSNLPTFSWIYDEIDGIIFEKETIIKIIRSGPIHPDSGGNEFYDTEQHFASGFGVIYHKEEPYGEVFLRGCIIDGNTFGIVTSVEDVITEVPEIFELMQNYPNPFNPTTVIEYEIKEFGLIKLKIYDILGNEIAVLEDGEKTAGKHTINFNGKNLSSGIYTYTLYNNGKVVSKKMQLIK